MSDEWKTIRVPKDVYDDAKDRKEEHNVTWGQYVNPHAWHSVFDEPAEGDVGDRLTAKITAEDMRPMIREEIADAMSEVTIDVTIDAEDSDVDESDVRNIVEKKLDELRRELH